MAKGRTNKQGGASVSLTGDAVVAEVLNGKTFYNTDPKTKLTGTMPNKVGSATVITPSTSDQIIPQGYYGGVAGDGKVTGDANLVAGNIKSGVNLFGVTGAYGSGGISMAIGLKNNVNSPLIYATLYCLFNSITPSNIYGVCMSESGQYVFYHYYNNVTYSLYKSNDYGVTFSAKVNEGNPYRGVVCSYDGKYVAVGNKISSDYGENFSSLPTNVYFSDMSYDGQIMYARKTDGYIYKSTDYGANWSNTNILGEHVVCSDDGSIVCFSRDISFQNYNFYRTTDGLATEGSLVITGNERAYCIISQDGSKYASYAKGTAGVPENSHKYMSIFNNGNYLTYNSNTVDANRYCSYLDASYYSKLFSIIGSSQSQAPSRFSNRIKNTNKFCVISSNTIYVLSQ